MTGVGFSPDLVWIKSRTSTQSHKLFDTIRGVQKELSSNSSGPEAYGANQLTAFLPDGFTVGSGLAVNETNANFIAWCWKASDTTVTNNEGTIESQVRSNGNFSVITYNPKSNGPHTVGHGLNTVPSMVFIKSIDRDSNWQVYHQSLGNTACLFLNSADEKSTAASYWNNSSPTDTVINLGNDFNVSKEADNLIAYAWAETPGVSSFGEYTGNGTPGTGPIVDCGFKPAFVLLRNPNISENWLIFDSVRDESARQYLVANDPNPEGVGGGWITFLDNGFQLNSNSTAVNPSGQSVIYAAFAGGNPIEVIDVDVDNNQMTVDASGYEAGDTVTGPPLIASADDVEYLDGNTLGVNGVSGTWLAGLHAQGAEVTANAPSPESIQYTSANGTPLTTPFTGTDATLTTRTWTWQVSNAVTGPWSDLTTRIDSPGQDGAVPLADRPTLEPNKFYQVKVRYDSNNAEFVESTFNTFKTGDN